MDHFADALQHDFALKQQKSSAGYQQKHSQKCEKCEFHTSPLHVDVDDLVDHKAA